MARGNPSGAYSLMDSRGLQYDTVDPDETVATSDVPRPADEAGNSKTTTMQTYLHLVKGYVGAGCLSLPWSFSQLGIIQGTLACSILCVWSSWNCSVIVTLKKRLNREHRESRQYKIVHTYPDVAGWAYGRSFELFVLTSICVQQLAICTVFFSFVGDNVLALWGSGDASDGSRLLATTLALPAVMGLSCLANLRQLAPATVVGTLTLLSAFGIVGAVMLRYHPFPDNPDEDSQASSSMLSIPLAMSSILYSYEGINLILPIESAMQHPKYFGIVFWTAMCTVAFLFSTVAVTCVLIFGRVTDGSVTAFLLTLDDLQGHQRDLVLTANMFVSLSVVLTYPLQLFPCLPLFGQMSMGWRDRHEAGEPHALQTVADDLIRPLLVGTPQNESDVTVEQTDEVEQTSSPGALAGTNIDDEVDESDGNCSDDDSISSARIPGDSTQLRLGLVLLTYLFAILIPNVSALISLAGALAGSSTALLIPPLIEIEVIRRTTKSVVGRVRCWTLFGFGLVFCMVGSGAAIADIVEIYNC